MGKILAARRKQAHKRLMKMTFQTNTLKRFIKKHEQNKRRQCHTVPHLER